MQLPFDGRKLDALMDDGRIDLLLATDKDSVQYLTGGYRFFFLAHKDAIGISRYLPVLGYPKGQPEKAFYVGHGLEPQHQAVEPLWVPNISNTQKSSEHAGRLAAERIRTLGLDRATIGVEMCFIPADAWLALREELPNATFVDVLPLMQALRAVKRPEELHALKCASEYIVDSMLAVMHTTRAGTTTFDIAEHVRREEVDRGMNFEYCLAAAGPNLNRTPSKKFTWKKGEILSLDSGANLHGYLGDLCRMAVMGRPTNLMRDLMDEVRAIQDAPRAVIRAGATGRDIYAPALAALDKCAHKSEVVFRAHGVGMIQHEAPHLHGEGIISYPAIYQDKPLEAGMVLSIETDLRNPDVGLVKLEDTVVVTATGCEGFGDGARDWVEVGG
jgi:Xaa-Pro aminopeptidase